MRPTASVQPRRNRRVSLTGASLKLGATAADLRAVGRSAIGLCALVGSFVGGYVPVLWGASAFSVMSLVVSAAGGAAGVWFGVRLSEY